ncbi:MAG: response regulator transcription factor [Lachnospirales bacterium]
MLIYVVEDDENIRDLVKIALEGNGYKVSAFETAEEGISAIKEKKPDLCIFDIMLPGMDGITAVKEIKKHNSFKDIPIIHLTAKDSEIDKVKGLDGGADDYITKPFGILELMARIRSVLRRSKNEDNNRETYGMIRINRDTREIFVNDEAVTLTFKEYELLKFLIDNKKRAVSRTELLNEVWGYEYIGETRTIDIHIRTIRQKLGVAGSYIKTLRGMGYRFKVED